MKTESARKFPRILMGYDPMAVDAHVEELTAKQQLLLDDIESLRARLNQSSDEVAALRKEVAVLNDTSPSPHAMQHRMAKMLRHAVDEAAQMKAEAKAEAEALVAAIESEAEAARHKHNEQLAEMAAERSALETECEETKKALDAEMTRKRGDARHAIDEAWQKANQERDQLLDDAKQEADHYREQARRVLNDAMQQRIKILEQLMGVFHGLEAVPADLEAAYRERNNPPESGVVVPFEQKSSTG